MLHKPVLAQARNKRTTSLLLTSGLFRTAAGAVGDELLRKHTPELREYLTIRMGTPEGGTLALEELEAAVARLPAGQLTNKNARARLYMLADGVIELRDLLGEASGVRVEPPWAALPSDAEPSFRAAVELVRTSLPSDDARLLELHHVRGLSIEDVALVRGLGVDRATSALRAAEAYASMLVEEKMGRDAAAIAEIARAAFKLDPLPERTRASDAVPPALAPGSLLAGRYEIETHVAEGAFGHVYKARDVLVPGHVVALKLLHRAARVPAAREGAIRELSLIASVFHPSVVQFKDHGWHEDRLWFVMPWYVGETLQERIDRGPLSPAEAWPIFERLARGLAALHAAGIRHQDIKPENIFLCEMAASADGTRDVLPVLLDLGVAAQTGDAALAGTPVYFSPEVAQRFVDPDATAVLTDRADVFALALTAMHALHPASMEQDAELEFDAFVKMRSERVPEIPRAPALSPHRAMLERWLAHDSKERPSAARLAEEMATLAQGTRASGYRKRHLFAWSAAAAAVATAISLAAVLPTGEAAAPAPVAQPAPADPATRIQHEVAVLRRQVESANGRAERLEEELSRLRQTEPTTTASVAP